MSTCVESLMRRISAHLNQKDSRKHEYNGNLGLLFLKWLKQQLRRPLQEKRRLLSPIFQQKAATAAAARLFATSYYHNARHIALYMAHAGEIATTTVLQHALAHKKCCYLPVLSNGKVLQFTQVTHNTSFFPNRFGILEPQSACLIAPHLLDLVLLPLVAFDSACHRLGMGAGYYDATFGALTGAPTKPLLVGFAYDFQKIAQVPCSDWDVPLDEVITEAHTYQPY